MKKKIKIIFILFIFLIILLNQTSSYAYKNNAFTVNVPNNLMGKDFISKNDIYGLGEGGNFLFITKENTSQNKIKEVKKSIMEYIKLEIKLYGGEKLIYKLKTTKIDDATAFIYEPSEDELLYYIPTDNYIIHVQILSSDETSPYQNNELMQVLNNIQITDSVNNIDYNKTSLTLINYHFFLKPIIIVFIIAIILIIIIVIIKKKNKK